MLVFLQIFFFTFVRFKIQFVGCQRQLPVDRNTDLRVYCRITFSDTVRMQTYVIDTLS